MQFVSPNEAWAIGYVPPGETGAGDYSILHTHDGGKTWSELPSSYQHNAPPSISFASRREGWIMIADVPADEQRLLRTGDGGAHWQRLPLRDLSVGGIQYLGDGFGYAYRFDYTNRGYLSATKDHGRHWNEMALPEGFRPDRMAFADRGHGLLAGCSGRDIVTITTSDGGQHWIKSRIDLPLAEATTENCNFQADNLSVIGARRGWLVINNHSLPKNGDQGVVAVAASTTNGGATWTNTYQVASQQAYVELTSVEFLNERLGFISSVEIPTDSNAYKGALLYTTDGGQTWQRMELPRPVWACRPYAEGLTCAAGGQGFWILRTSLAKRR